MLCLFCTIIRTGDRMDTKTKLYKVLRTSIDLHQRVPILRELQARVGPDVPALREALKELHTGSGIAVLMATILFDVVQ